MEKFVSREGLVAPLDRANVDTDAIIPKQFLKRIERTGFGQFLFFDWRFLADGSPNPDFELNRPELSGASKSACSTVSLPRMPSKCSTRRRNSATAAAVGGVQSGTKRSSHSPLFRWHNW